ncbi:MAG: hypothetical protein IIB44_08120 [Candidatus Marinimicrobia bacterium]|nr:hypothetical protein [Candidatus Neomarinimicrobiota bacterium]MCH8068085.1 hypothetical protein [Candidatus Neomarinimicrobiota bacterium]
MLLQFLDYLLTVVRKKGGQAIGDAREGGRGKKKIVRKEISLEVTAD